MRSYNTCGPRGVGRLSGYFSCMSTIWHTDQTLLSFCHPLSPSLPRAIYEKSRHDMQTTKREHGQSAEKPLWREDVLSDDCPTLQAVAPGENLVGLYHRPSFDIAPNTAHEPRYRRRIMPLRPPASHASWSSRALRCSMATRPCLANLTATRLT